MNYRALEFPAVLSMGNSRKGSTSISGVFPEFPESPSRTWILQGYPVSSCQKPQYVLKGLDLRRHRERERAQNEYLHRIPQIFTGAPSPGSSSFWRARKRQTFAESHWKPQIGVRHLTYVTLSSPTIVQEPRLKIPWT